MAEENPQKDAEALALWRAGAPFEAIAEKLHYQDATQAEEAATRALRASSNPDAEDMRKLELHRLDVLHMALWPKARRGDQKAVEQIMDIQKARRSLDGTQNDDRTLTLTQAVDRSIASSEVYDENKDAALAALIRRIAEHIDAASASGSLEMEQKSLYLMPHMMNGLRELEATPASRRAVKEQVKEAGHASRLVDFQGEASATKKS